MASVFDLFGTLDFKTGTFENSAKHVAARLQGLDSQLDKTIASSNKLGDTSATVARRYDKLSEGIDRQRQKLIDNALAFEKGEITGKRFATVLEQVDRAALGVSSRIRDAKARITELNETNFTHFQQQIQGAVVPQAGGISGMFKNLSSYQKTQLSFQANDVISGLAMGQSPMQILAQQGGQIVQIFQQTKMNAAATAAEINTAAAGATVLKTEMIGAAAASSSMAVSMAAMAAPFAAAAVAGFAVVKLSQDIRAEAEKRLKTETAITAQWNAQINLAGELKDRLAKEAEGRSWDRFAGGDDMFSLTAARDRLLQEHGGKAKAVADELMRRTNLLNQVPSLGAGYVDKDVIGKAVGADPELMKKQADQISELTKRIEGLKLASADRQTETLFGGNQRYIESVRKNQASALKAAEEAAEKSAKEAKRKAEEHLRDLKEASGIAVGVFGSTSDNPFVKNAIAAAQAVERIREAVGGLNSGLAKTLETMTRNASAANAFGQSLDNKLAALGYRDSARQFQQGFLDKVNASESLKKQFAAIGIGNALGIESKAYDFTGGKIGALIKPPGLDAARQKELDERIIALTKGLDPAQLTAGQRYTASGALLRSADQKDREQQEAAVTMKRLANILEKLEPALQSGSVVRIINEAPDRAKVTTNPTAATTAAYYSK